MKIVITDHDYMDFQEEKELFEAAGATLEITQCKTEDEVIESASGAFGLINSDIPITRSIIESLPELKVIAKYGIGVDQIDVKAATENGVFVANVPDYCQEEVANHALALIMSLNRKVVYLNNQVKNGRWAFSDAAPLARLNTQTVGLVSFGGIARILARKLQAIGFQVIAHDPYIQKEHKDSNVQMVSLEELMRRADIISIHAPLAEGTYHMINKDMLQLVKPHAAIVNTGRGPIINEMDLITALKQGEIAAAALDVLEQEPMNPDNPLLAMDNVILTPHVAFYSEESMAELKKKTAQNILDVIQGNRPAYLVNSEVTAGV